MDKLNLPALKINVYLPRSLSMEDYLEFVSVNLKYVVDKKSVREQKKLAAVNVPFSLNSKA